MNGLQALQAMLEGKTVILIRNAWRHNGNMRPSRDDTYYRFTSEYTNDHRTEGGYIWSRNRDHWAWHKCENPTEFWMRCSAEGEDCFILADEEEGQ